MRTKQEILDRIYKLRVGRSKLMESGINYQETKEWFDNQIEILEMEKQNEINNHNRGKKQPHTLFVVP